MVTTIMSDRQTGKSTEAVRLFLKDYKNTLLLVTNKNCKNEILKKVFSQMKELNKPVELEALGKNIIIGTPSNLYGLKYKTVIIDEFLFFRNYFRLYKEVTITSNNIYLFSNYNKQNLAEETEINHLSNKIYHSVGEYLAGNEGKIKVFNIYKFKKYYNEHQTNN